jgi:AcrR family transcriptional regulator
MIDRTRPRDGRRARWDEHRASRRHDLIDAAVLAVQQLGPDVGMDDIAHHAGVSKPVFYRYFTDKADLHNEVGRYVAEIVVRQVNDALDADGTVRDRVAAGIDCYLRLIEADPELYDYVVHKAPARRSSPDRTSPVEDYANVVGFHASQVIGAVLRDVGGDVGAAEPWGYGVVGMVRAAADRWLQHPTMPRAALVAYLADLVAPGLLAALPADLGPGGSVTPLSRSAPLRRRRRA